MKPGNMSKIIIAVLIGALVFTVGLSSRISAQQADEKKKEEKKDSSALNEFSEVEVTGWRIRDFKPYIKAIQELEKLNKEYSDNLLKLAIDEYSTGLDILEDMENEVIKIRTTNKEKKNLNERWYWQEIDRKNAEQRLIWSKKTEAKMKSVTYLTKAINYLDQVQHQEIRQEPRFLNFQTRLFQVYVSTQYDLQNFLPCIALLERYITLSDKNAKDIWAYKYMSSCYGYMEKVLQKYRHASEDEINTYKSKKNRSMLQAVELKYGIESPHYKHMQELVEQDEKKSERINDYK
ncbi:MAG: hypothetical protein KA369_04735 [Spirochaetes bacterium]|nr:hypothetical protein [Spirochaetota bacterium]